jgi:hypothetical protein
MTTYVPPTPASLRRKADILRALDRADRNMLEAALCVASLVVSPDVSSPDVLQFHKDRFVSLRNQYDELLAQLDKFQFERSSK